MSDRRSAPAGLALKAFALAVALSGAATSVTGCRPALSDEDLLLEQPDASCAIEARDVPLDPAAQSLLQMEGRAIGEVSARGPAGDYVRRLTRDGYWLRQTSSTLVMGIGLLCVGALGAAFLLVALKKRPPPRWGAELAGAVEKETAALRALAAHGDALVQELVARADEVLGKVVVKAEQLAARARPLEERADTATAVGHLQSLYAQLEGLLGRVERAHLHIVGWVERRGRDEDDEVKRQIGAAVDLLAAALQEVGP